MCYLVARSCLILVWPHDCSPLGSSVHGVFQARILEWVAISFSRGSSWPKDWTCVSCIGRQILYNWMTGEAPVRLYTINIIISQTIKLNENSKVSVYVYDLISLANMFVMCVFTVDRKSNTWLNQNSGQWLFSLGGIKEKYCQDGKSGHLLRYRYKFS